MKAVTPFALVALLAPLVGCEELEPYTPKVHFQDLEVRDISFERADVDFVFDVENPNPVDIELASFSYNLGFEEVPLFDGSDDDGMALPAVDSAELRLPVGFAWEDAWNTVQATRGEDFVDFGLDGHFGFDTPIGEAQIPYDEGGNFPAVRTPKFRFQKVRVTRVNFLQNVADLEIDLGVDNDHASSLFFENFDYELKIDGNDVASGVIEDLGAVNGAEEGTLVLPVSVTLTEVGETAWDAINGNGNLRTRVYARTDVDTPFGLLPLSIDETGDVSVEDDR